MVVISLILGWGLQWWVVGGWVSVYGGGWWLGFSNGGWCIEFSDGGGGGLDFLMGWWWWLGWLIGFLMG